MNKQSAINYLNTLGMPLHEQDFEQNQKFKVVVGMSGGVDSSVCAALLKCQGYQVIGVFMKNWEEEDENGECTSERDYNDAKKVADQLEIPFYALNFVEEYKKNVFDYFISEYKKGNTPNPDILCNREIKFKVFFEKAIALGADYLATGHYCQKRGEGTNAQLLKGVDANKDQTYFLYAIEQSVLNKVLFPIGHLEKKIVRQIAKDFNLATATKKDSTGICFIGERDFKEFLSHYIQNLKGNFVHLESQKILGAHDGYCFYTPGQRKGLGLGGPGGPWFVADKNLNQNIVYVVEGEHHPALYADELWASEVSWIGHTPLFPMRVKAKIRYRQEDQSCTVVEDAGMLKVIFDNPQRAISVKQAIVFYQDDVCLGGAEIQKIGESFYQQQKPLPQFGII
jgi:tRNA-uridine 2-sulfurtransferase